MIRTAVALALVYNFEDKLFARVVGDFVPFIVLNLRATEALVFHSIIFFQNWIFPRVLSVFRLFPIG